MNNPIPEPLSGKHVLDWAVPVTRALNALGDKVGATARNERDRRGASSPDMGCWKIVVGSRTENEGEEDEATVPVRVFANQYCLAGEILHEFELEAAVEDFVCQGELGEGEEYTAADRPYIALKISATTGVSDAELVGYETLADLQADQTDFAYAIKLLYKLTHDGSIAVDFRNCPAFQFTEPLPTDEEAQ